MFTGIVEKTAALTKRDGRVLEIARAVDLEVGDSVAVNGVCLTVAGVGEDTFRVELSEETSNRTTLTSLEEGELVNLERAMPADGRFGGHFVQGHVDGIAYLLEQERHPNSVEVVVEYPSDLGRYIAEKGSVAIDGISLTVVKVDGDRFTASLVPHTLDVTNLGKKRPGDPVNIEVDLIAKYVARFSENAFPREDGPRSEDVMPDFPEAPRVGAPETRLQPREFPDR